MNDDILSQKIALLPTNPGVYIMRDCDEHVIYVGKAKNLKNRVKQYFLNSVKTNKVQAMVDNICDFEYIITETEVDALSLENNLIKKYKPRYNILLKDDKTYPYLKIDLSNPYPYFEVVRKISKDKCKYFGPYMGGVNVRDMLDIINQTFKIRACKIKIDPKKPIKPCLNYHIDRCKGVCGGNISQTEYMSCVEGALDFLYGNDDMAEQIITDRMKHFSSLEQFEIALNYREKLKALNIIKQKKITNLNRFLSADIIAITSNGISSCVNILFTRNGRMLGGKNFALEGVMGDEDKLVSFIMQYYKCDVELPAEIILSLELSEAELLKQYFKDNFDKNISLTAPKMGVKKSLVDMANTNAEDYLEKQIEKIKHRDDMTISALQLLQKQLNLKVYPKRMECYDISHISGEDKVGSMVVFIDGEKDAKSYRRFRIKTVKGSDDFACLKEVLQRRLDKLVGEDSDKFPMPDLIIIDGGKGQLSSVESIFKQNNCNIELISLAKREEEIFTTYSKEPIILSHRDYSLKVLQRIRDESHRFAITYHRSLRDKRMVKSEIASLVGLGMVRVKLLQDKFGSIENIKRASISDLMEIDGIGEKLAKSIKEQIENGEFRPRNN